MQDYCLKTCGVCGGQSGQAQSGQAQAGQAQAGQALSGQATERLAVGFEQCPLNVLRGLEHENQKPPTPDSILSDEMLKKFCESSMYGPDGMAYGYLCMVRDDLDSLVGETPPTVYANEILHKKIRGEIDDQFRTVSIQRLLNTPPPKLFTK